MYTTGFLLMAAVRHLGFAIHVAWDRPRIGLTFGGLYRRAMRSWIELMVSVLDSGAEGPGFKSQLRRCRVTVLGKLFTPIVPLFTKQRNW